MYIWLSFITYKFLHVCGIGSRLLEKKKTYNEATALQFENADNSNISVLLDVEALEILRYLVIERNININHLTIYWLSYCLCFSNIVKIPYS